ncbi:hypothetical protein [Corynebacterium glutamicum]|uniref:hypothetical protein n=1 Tax=Corynebacterium glutamicum TaxID=1718 RepID=UPI0014664FB4|nr:hypothetical protein [Corynebacterium glutamicum]GFK19233.1 hypothetical protein KbCgl_18050 [Corynebacterium glutamicum]
MISTLLKTAKTALLKTRSWKGWKDREVQQIVLIVRNIDDLIRIYEVRSPVVNEHG